MTTKAARRPKPNSFSEELRRAIELSGLTHYSLGKMSDVDPGLITRFTKGERSVTSATIDRLAAALAIHLTMPQVQKKPRKKPAIKATAPIESTPSE